MATSRWSTRLLVAVTGRLMKVPKTKISQPRVRSPLRLPALGRAGTLQPLCWPPLRSPPMATASMPTTTRAAANYLTVMSKARMTLRRRWWRRTMKALAVTKMTAMQV
jgi:hypothetical protein